MLTAHGLGPCGSINIGRRCSDTDTKAERNTRAPRTLVAGTLTIMSGTITSGGVAGLGHLEVNDHTYGSLFSQSSMASILTAQTNQPTVWPCLPPSECPSSDVSCHGRQCVGWDLLLPYLGFAGENVGSNQGTVLLIMCYSTLGWATQICWRP